MKTTKILILLLLLPILTYGKDILKGYICDSQKQPLIGAAVRWENAKTGVITNDEGYFEIEGTPHKDHMLAISYIRIRWCIYTISMRYKTSHWKKTQN